jgi:hypothetical protein
VKQARDERFNDFYGHWYQFGMYSDAQRGTLKNFSMVCKAARELANDVLFEDFVFRSSWIVGSQGSDLEIILPRVRRLILPSMANPNISSSFGQQLQTFKTPLIVSSSTLPLLHTLSISSFPWPYVQTPEEEKEFMTWLLGFKNLQRLELTEGDPSPLLEALAGQISELKVIIPTAETFNLVGKMQRLKRFEWVVRHQDIASFKSIAEVAPSDKSTWKRLPQEVTFSSRFTPSGNGLQATGSPLFSLTGKCPPSQPPTVEVKDFISIMNVIGNMTRRLSLLNILFRRSNNLQFPDEFLPLTSSIRLFQTNFLEHMPLRALGKSPVQNIALVNVNPYLPGSYVHSMTEQFNSAAIRGILETKSKSESWRELTFLEVDDVFWNGSMGENKLSAFISDAAVKIEKFAEWEGWREWSKQWV